VPQNPTYNTDATLWLSRNAGRILKPWTQTPIADEIQRLTLAYQATPALENIVARSAMLCENARGWRPDCVRSDTGEDLADRRGKISRIERREHLMRAVIAAEKCTGPCKQSRCR
jgi:hypothetical protein